MLTNIAALTIEQKLSSGALLSLRREFCPWAGVCAVTAYKEIARGHLKIVKVGRKTMVTGTDACLMTFRAEKARRNRWERVAALSSAARVGSGVC
jgi:hypothetical protein